MVMGKLKILYAILKPGGSFPEFFWKWHKGTQMSSYERDILLRENIQLKWSGIFQNICGRLIANMPPIFYHFLYPYHWQCDLAAHFISRWNLSHAPLNLGQPHDCVLANRMASKGRCAHSDSRPWRPHMLLLALFCPCHVKKPGISFSRR